MPRLLRSSRGTSRVKARTEMTRYMYLHLSPFNVSSTSIFISEPIEAFGHQRLLSRDQNGSFNVITDQVVDMLSLACTISPTGGAT